MTGTKLLKMGDFEKCNTKTIHESDRNHEGLYSVFSGGVGSARALVSEEAKKAVEPVNGTRFSQSELILRYLWTKATL